jgi:hypothetical protein
MGIPELLEMWNIGALLTVGRCRKFYFFLISGFFYRIFFFERKEKGNKTNNGRGEEWEIACPIRL